VFSVEGSVKTFARGAFLMKIPQSNEQAMFY
jgi:hypothetical protein